MSKEWYDKVLPQTTTSDEFESWWLSFYGKPDDYGDEDEYWIRKAFAWYGWFARGEQQ